MNVLSQIKKEHNDFRKVLKEIEKDKVKKADKFEKFISKLLAHHKAEEEILFKDLSKKSDAKGKNIVLEMIEEHHLGQYQSKVIQKISEKNKTWDAKFTVFKEVLEHHMEEEETDLFKKAKKYFSKEELKNKYEDFEKISSKNLKDKDVKSSKK